MLKTLIHLLVAPLQEAHFPKQIKHNSSHYEIPAIFSKSRQRELIQYRITDHSFNKLMLLNQFGSKSSTI